MLAAKLFFYDGQPLQIVRPCHIHDAIEAFYAQYGGLTEGHSVLIGYVDIPIEEYTKLPRFYNVI